MNKYPKHTTAIAELSPAQKDVLEKMAAGWELRHMNRTVGCGWQLFKDGKRVAVKGSTANSLAYRSLIEHHQKNVEHAFIDKHTFGLTPAGREAAKEQA